MNTMKKKTIVMIALIVAICVMATGYAILRQQLVVTGTSSITSTWKVNIVGITTSDVVGDSANKSTPTYTDTTAKFKASLINPGDSITYNIKIKNSGTLIAKVSNYSVDIGDNDAITYEVEGLENDAVLVPDAEQTVKVKVSFKTGYVGQPSVTTNNIKVIINYVQKIDSQSSNNENIEP